MSVAAAGYIEIYLNGEKAGDHVLDPAPAMYDLTVTKDGVTSSGQTPASK